MKYVVMDTNNQALVKAILDMVADTKMREMLTDLEFLDNIAEVVNKRKLTWGTTDCNTGLTYDKVTF